MAGGWGGWGSWGRDVASLLSGPGWRLQVGMLTCLLLMQCSLLPLLLPLLLLLLKEAGSGI